MAAVTFDTRETFAKLTRAKTFTEKQAETLVDIMKDTHSEVATQADIAMLRTELVGEIKALRGEMQALFWKLAAVFIIANAAMRYLPVSHI